eukprot:TRINITY_DN5057_c2_g1_i2.p1 TRINITY_DN5057_c2_g1~~TRINITY_DN5057_c2_g1_i2.p1  ORF type:complete len:714 (+),score=100.22 TRINITY_DN5057_c2_g1_i2:662-2803(+)
MIACDFCNEWYHGKCIGLSATRGKRLERFKCPACTSKEVSENGGESGSHTPTRETTTPTTTEGTPASEDEEEEEEAPPGDLTDEEVREYIRKTIRSKGVCSVSFLRRALGIGYKRAKRHHDEVMLALPQGDVPEASDTEDEEYEEANDREPEQTSTQENSARPTTRRPPRKANQDQGISKDDKRSVAEEQDADDSTTSVLRDRVRAALTNALRSYFTIQKPKQEDDTMPVTLTSKVAPESDSTPSANVLAAQLTAELPAASTEPIPDPMITSTTNTLAENKTEITSETASSPNTTRDTPPISNHTEVKESSAPTEDTSNPSHAQSTLNTETKSHSEAQIPYSKTDIKDEHEKQEGEVLVTEERAAEVADQIEQEMFELYNSTTDRDYKAKYRTLLHNLSGERNHELRRRVLTGLVTPHDLCRMNSQELAPKELSLWRERRTEQYFAENVIIPATDSQLPIVKKTHKGEEVVQGLIEELEAPEIASSDEKQPTPPIKSTAPKTRTNSDPVIRKDELMAAQPTIDIKLEGAPYRGGSGISSVLRTGAIAASSKPSTGAILWRGTLSKTNMDKCTVVAVHVSGPGIQTADGSSSMQGFLNSTLHVQGRVELTKLATYVQRLQGSRSREYSVCMYEAQGPDESQAAYASMLEYFAHRERAGVVINLSGRVKEMYIIPYAPADPLTTSILLSTPATVPTFTPPDRDLLIGVIVTERVS